jgi:hypothetical protein
MQLLIIRSKWDFDNVPLEQFLAHIREAGFDGSEIHLPSIRETPGTVTALHKQYGLRHVTMITTEGTTPGDHLRFLEESFARAAEFQPIHINCHPGRDLFPHEENARIIGRSLELSEKFGIPICHETHRGRATYSAFSTAALLEAVPGMRLTADFSHWVCVHESLLLDHERWLGPAISAAGYIHARVGYIEGPQVNDPRAPEWQAEVQAHVGWWKRIAEAHRRNGSAYLAICPEFGPWPYMPALPYTGVPVTNLWDVTVYMMGLLRSSLAG